MRSNALRQKVIGVLPGTRVAIALRKAQAGIKLKKLTAVQRGQRCFRGGGKKRDADTTINWNKRGGVWRQLLDTRKRQVHLKRCRRRKVRRIRLPGVLGVGRNTGGAGRERPGAHHGAFHGAREVVGKGPKGELGERRGRQVQREHTRRKPQGKSRERGRQVCALLVALRLYRGQKDQSEQKSAG